MFLQNIITAIKSIVLLYPSTKKSIKKNQLIINESAYIDNTIKLPIRAITKKANITKKIKP